MVYHGIVLFWYIIGNSGFSTIVLLLYIMGFTTMGLFYPRENHKKKVVNPRVQPVDSPTQSMPEGSPLSFPTLLICWGQESPKTQLMSTPD